MATTTTPAAAATIAAIEAPMRRYEAQLRTERSVVAPVPRALVAPSPVVTRDRACCAAAVRLVCVCAVAWRCPTHGESHHGTHD